MADPVLTVRDLHLAFRKGRQRTEVLHGISLHVNAGEKVALVGESGSGKSVTAQLALARLQQEKGTEAEGLIEVLGHDATRSPARIAAMRGHRVTMIFQDPTSALNPVFRIGEIFEQVLRAGGQRLRAQEARRRAEAALAEVQIPDPARALDSYPFQLSGGMNQRVMIAMALANGPELLLADEPGTALDVTVQAQTLRLMDDLVTSRGTAVLFISHNLSVVREFADRVYVIYRGRIVEHGRTEQLFSDPRHPYTKALLAAAPRLLGGGLPDLPQGAEAFADPLLVHDGCAEPGEVTA
ncbi:ATP-binding cassette domain-containing protein [Pseudoroseicyclus aestuarii]|uniref:ABC-type dipeptide/oligopeptide/nickel transport system ATPase component n=1 Tax=Pseudoroseicyclus aestuarii TaxID=1795041 RepID=A0A318T015_9RHOB|nr:ABC transporter ATP-binding protein [Pseudoroseicyclus aestuarii]PYE82427.1 ABC-type dipeptide/oligopeptide/nickel transport system ATPase component [Pseudoroseicyclus aestuarii]